MQEIIKSERGLITPSTNYISLNRDGIDFERYLLFSSKVD